MVDGLSLALSLALVGLVLLAAMYTSALGVIKMHRMIIECLNTNIESQKRQKKYWRRQYYKAKKAEELKRG